MKILVMIGIYRECDRGRLDLDREVVVATEFRSVQKDQSFGLTADEADEELALVAGRPAPVRDLLERMITRSSNHATNLLMELTGVPPLGTILRDLGATGSRLERSIGDYQAEASGISNVVTPLDLCRVLAGIASGRAASPSSCHDMIALLCRQKDRAGIPAGIGAGARVANKTGWDPGLRHDAALVWPNDGPGYCLAVCTSGFDSDAAAKIEIQARSRACYEERQLVAERQS